EIVNKFFDPRINFSKNEVNIGAENLVLNCNNALAKANGDFFIMMGDDDKLEPNYLGEFRNLINKYSDLDVFHCRSKIIDEHSIPFKLTPSWPEYETVYDSIWHRINGFRLQFISDFVYRTSVLKKNGGFFDIPLAWASDDITAYIASQHKGIAHTNLPIFNYRQTRFTITSTGNSNLKMKAILIEKNWYDSFLKIVPSDPNDRIIYGSLVKLLDGYIRNKKLRTLSDSLDSNFFGNLSNWNKSKSLYHITLTDIAKAAFNSLKKRI
ncbi:MAG: glycosyltransferase family 2 protein, partial [Mucilaginibacter sp.]